MTYRTLMVHLELGHLNGNLLAVAGDLAQRFDAGVIGIAMCQPMQIIYSEGYVPADVILEDREQRENEVAAAEAEFRNVLQGRVGRLDFRSEVTSDPLADYLARQARSADLIITGVEHNASVFDHSRHVNIGDVVMHVGRPILVVPTAASGVSFDSVMVGWKDTRETRRAIVDALPFLQKATQIAVVEIVAEPELEAARERLDDVVRWLGCHGVAAEPIARKSAGEDAHQLLAAAQERGAGVIVAGAYGHSRVREWVLGGVTRDLLLRAGRCALVSH
ncbi:MAG TPA: universal stress protein [Acetobacteraceae bacterium]|nr:universal stress protein [Acetobacteraceae bacterium]